ncbi:MAG: tRNA uridine-5-carboxymethylaminomethyl(34) synthesis GTPase MnmE [Acidobacteria bacterium]|nr:tRNA uridine-5-carboxymethylaminomethyl(34) synthesis GTPase MnmE [Acidobacteriota bacterium]
MASPPGRSAIGVVRLSGPDALELTQRLFRAESRTWPAPQHATVGILADPADGETIDQAVVCFFKSPHSYTGEDLVELSCHGSPVILNRVVETLLSMGARAARPGEFTLRSFLHGRMDLTQAEAVQDLINADTRFQSRIAIRQVQGSLARELLPIKTTMIDLIAEMETAVEFVDERLVDTSAVRLIGSLRQLSEELRRLADTFHAGRVLREGIQLAIVGKPNVGKSSLFNYLLKRDRAIVTEIPGTTRDMLLEPIILGGIPFRLVDTAGVRPTTDPVEIVGIERTRRAIADADLAILLIDHSRELDDQDWELLGLTTGIPRLVVMNKIDLPCGCALEAMAAVEAGQFLRVSVKTGEGLGVLAERILDVALQRERLGIEDVIITNSRHHQLLRAATVALEEAERALLDGASEEVPLTYLNEALSSLGEITGETTVDDILERVFANFCVGK